MSVSRKAKVIVLVMLAIAMATTVTAAPKLNVKWVKNISIMVGVPEGQGGVRWGAPVTYDFDGDGKREIFFGLEYIHRLVMCNYDGSLKWIYPTPDQEEWAMMIRPPCIADIDNDGTAEMIFSSRNPGKIMAMEWTGEIIFEHTDWKGHTGSFAGGPIARDFYPDIPGLEITFGGKHFWGMLKADGTEIWDIELAGGCDYVPNAFDIDKDGEIEILILCRDTNAEGLKVIDSHGVEEWRYVGPGVHAGGMWLQPTICDIDNDGEWDILLGSADEEGSGLPTGAMHCLNWYGQVKWRYDLPADQSEGKYIRCQAAVGDVNKDGFLEVAFQAGAPGYFYLLDHNGNLIWKKNTSTRSGYGCSIADVNNDGNLEILFGAYDKNKPGILYVWDKDGNDVFEPWDAGAEGYGDSPASLMCPEVCDLDGDGKVDIFWNWYEKSLKHGYLGCFTTGADMNPDLMVFPMYGATPDMAGMPQNWPAAEPLGLLLLALAPIGLAISRKR